MAVRPFVCDNYILQLIRVIKLLLYGGPVNKARKRFASFLFFISFDLVFGLRKKGLNFEFCPTKDKSNLMECVLLHIYNFMDKGTK